MKKNFIIFFVLLMAFILAAGCSSDESSKEKKKDSELTFVSWSSEESSGKVIKDKMVKSWNEEHPDTKFNVMGYPWDQTLQQLTIKAQSGDKLDVAQIQSSWFNILATQDILVDLKTVLDPDWIKETFTESALKAGQLDGKQYALPWTIAAIAPLYNPGILKDAGIDSPPTTVEGFENALKAVKESSSDIIPYAISTDSSENISQDFQAWLWTFGGQVFDESGEVAINNSNGVETLQWLKSLKDKGYIQMGMDRVSARDSFGLDQVAFYDDSIVARGFQVNQGHDMEDMDNHLVPMERPVLKEGDTPQSVLWGHYLVVFKGSKEPEKSAEFIKNMLKDDLSIDYFKSASVPPVTKTAKEDPIVQNDNYVTKYLEVADNASPLETEPFTNSKELNTIIAEEIQAVLLGNKTAQEALDTAAKRMSDAVEG